MTKFYGGIGYAEEAVEEPPGSGVWKEHIIEKLYYGDVNSTARQLRDDSKINGNVFPDMTISVVADAYALNNFAAIRYIRWQEKVWDASRVSVEYHRLIVTLGGVYHGPKANPA